MCVFRTPRSFGVWMECATKCHFWSTASLCWETGSVAVSLPTSTITPPLLTPAVAPAVAPPPPLPCTRPRSHPFPLAHPHNQPQLLPRGQLHQDVPGFRGHSAVLEAPVAARRLSGGPGPLHGLLRGRTGQGHGRWGGAELRSACAPARCHRHLWGPPQPPGHGWGT